MGERVLQLFCIVLFIVGVLLFLASETPAIQVTSLDQSMVGKRVQLTNIIAGIFIKDNIAFITAGKNRVIVFSAFQTNALFLEKGQAARFEGEVIHYKGNLELVADKVVVLD